jgi:hypothetical protein
MILKMLWEIKEKGSKIYIKGEKRLLLQLSPKGQWPK